MTEQALGSGVLAESANIPRWAAIGTTGPLPLGTWLEAVYITEPRLVTGIVIFIRNSGEAPPGDNGNRMGLYRLVGNDAVLVAQTEDDADMFAQPPGYLMRDFETPYQAEPGLYYGALVCSRQPALGASLMSHVAELGFPPQGRLTSRLWAQNELSSLPSQLALTVLSIQPWSIWFGLLGTPVALGNPAPPPNPAAPQPDPVLLATVGKLTSRGVTPAKVLRALWLAVANGDHSEMTAIEDILTAAAAENHLPYQSLTEAVMGYPLPASGRQRDSRGRFLPNS